MLSKFRERSPVAIEKELSVTPRLRSANLKQLTTSRGIIFVNIPVILIERMLKNAYLSNKTYSLIEFALMAYEQFLVIKCQILFKHMKYILFVNTFLITCLNEYKLIPLHTVKYFKVLQWVTNNSIKHPSFVYT